MKRRGFLIEQIAQTDNLLLAYYKASKGKHTKHEVIEYEKKLEENISNLQNRLLSNNVHIGDYTYFQIHDPKLRTICAASFSERVLHHAIMNICHPDFEKRLIDTTYASRKNKGTYVAIDRAKKAVRKYEYIGKFDVRHYFDSIDHRILIDMLNSMFKDDNLMQLLEKIISSYHTSKNKGLPIGNLTSQYFANHYLCKFDHYCKENLGVQEYIRYMDDFLVFSDTKEELLEKTRKIETYMQDKLRLTIKPPIIVKTTKGVCFLGYKLYREKVFLSYRSKKRLIKKMNLYFDLLRKNIWDEQTYNSHIVPLIAFSSHANSKGLRRMILSKQI